MESATQPLLEDYSLEEVDYHTWMPYALKHMHIPFSETVIFDPMLMETEVDRARKEDYERKTAGLFTLFYLVKKGDEIVGWHSSKQVKPEVLYMQLTGIYPEHQGKGLYKKVLKIVVERAKAEGFTIIESKHLAGNNAVLVPKMRAGFSIYSFDMNIHYGLMVHLRYFLREQEKDLYRFRTGSHRLPEKYRPYVALWDSDPLPDKSK